jgi:hypothetical protein
MRWAGLSDEDARHMMLKTRNVSGFERLNMDDSNPTARLAAVHAFALLTDSDYSRA